MTEEMALCDLKPGLLVMVTRRKGGNEHWHLFDPSVVIACIYPFVVVRKLGPSGGYEAREYYDHCTFELFPSEALTTAEQKALKAVRIEIKTKGN